MKKSLMLFSAMVISTFMFAQNDSAPQRHGGNRGETMKTVLSLDDKQTSSIEEINKKYHEKGKEERKGLQQQREAEISKVLTPEQNKKWTDYKKERSDRLVKARDERVKKHLNLSDDQLKQLKSTLSEEQFNKLAFGEGRHGGRGRHHGRK